MSAPEDEPVDDAQPTDRELVDLELLLRWMWQHGSSIILNGSSDEPPAWEASWITGGQRFTGFSGEPLRAVRQALSKAQAATFPMQPTGFPLDGQGEKQGDSH